jgi:hypothetical protein
MRHALANYRPEYYNPEYILMREAEAEARWHEIRRLRKLATKKGATVEEIEGTSDVPAARGRVSRRGGLRFVHCVGTVD